MFPHLGLENCPHSCDQHSSLLHLCASWFIVWHLRQLVAMPLQSKLPLFSTGKTTLSSCGSSSQLVIHSCELDGLQGFISFHEPPTRFCGPVAPATGTKESSKQCGLLCFFYCGITPSSMRNSVFLLLQHVLRHHCLLDLYSGIIATPTLLWYYAASCSSVRPNSSRLRHVAGLNCHLVGQLAASLPTWLVLL
jgi:hypothetical protein